jgi:flagellar hook-length control protein FliK
MFSCKSGILFMILASQSQKEAPKLAQSAVQSQNTTVQVGEEAFSLLLAMMNGQGDSADALTSLADASDDLAGLDLNAIADKDARAAKIADWFAANPASLAALGALSSVGAGAMPSIAGAMSPVAGVQLQGKSPPGDIKALFEALGAKEGASAALGVELVAAIQSAGDGQTMAAALMAAAGANLSVSKDAKPNSSNLLLARGLLGDQSLAEALSQALDPMAKALNGVSPLGNLTNQIDRSESDALLGAVPTPTDAASARGRHFDEMGAKLARSADEQRHMQLQQSDALLVNNYADLQTGIQQAMAAQQMGRAAIANANTLEGTVSWLASQQGGVATIDLTPPELGSLRLELKIDAAGESATLVVHAATESAKAAIEQSLDRLYESFQGSGLSLQVSVGGGSSGFSSGLANGFEGANELGAASIRASSGSRAEVISATTSKAQSASDALSLYA